MLSAVVVITALLFAGYLAFSPRLKGSSYWKAMVTPLASIMGSGFLVSAPLMSLVHPLWTLKPFGHVVLVIAVATMTGGLVAKAVGKWM